MSTQTIRGSVRSHGSLDLVDQWLGSNFVEMFAQLGWGFAPIGETVPLRG